MNGLRGHPTSMILTSERASRQKVTLRERQSKELCQRVKYLHTGASFVLLQSKWKLLRPVDVQNTSAVSVQVDW